MYWSSKQAAFPACGGPRTAVATSSSIAASTSRAPGKNRLTDAKPCAVVSAHERLGAPREAIDSPRLDALASHGPQLIAQMLFDERNLRLHREDDVAQPGLRAAIRRETGEDPRRSLLVHQAARPVDRIDEQTPPAVALCGAARQHESTRRQSLGYQHERLLKRELLEPGDERLFAHPVYGVDGIADAVVGDVAQRPGALRRERIHHARADSRVQVENRRQQPTRIAGGAHALAAR